MTAAYLYGAVRTTFGRFNGALAGVRPDDLASYVIKALLKRHPQLDGGAESMLMKPDNPFPGWRQHSGVHSPWLAADQQSDATRVDRLARRVQRTAEGEVQHCAGAAGHLRVSLQSARATIFPIDWE
jgi:hypothetical protein